MCVLFFRRLNYSSRLNILDITCAFQLLPVPTVGVGGSGHPKNSRCDSRLRHSRDVPGLDLPGGRPGNQLNQGLTKTMINHARQLSRNLVGIYHQSEIQETHREMRIPERDVRACLLTYAYPQISTERKLIGGVVQWQERRSWAANFNFFHSIGPQLVHCVLLYKFAASTLKLF